MPEHLGHEGANQLEHHGVPLGLGNLGETPRERLAGVVARAAGGRADEVAEQRRGDAGARLGAQRAEVETHRQEQRLVEGARGVQQLEAPLGLEREHGHARMDLALGALEAGLVHAGGHVARPRPQSPCQRAGRQAVGTAPLRERVHERVRGGVVARQLVEVKRGVGLRLHHAVDALGVE